MLEEALDVLMVVDPSGNLPGAATEGKTLRHLFWKLRPRLHLTLREGHEATKQQLLQDFQSGRYDIVHYAGHAAFDPIDLARRGLLCADDKFLTGDDLRGLTSLPTLLFLNVCQSGRTRGAAPRPIDVPRENPLRNSVSVAEAFLNGGLKLFLGTYWPVDDPSAMKFSETFYSKVIESQPIGEAVLAARRDVQQLGRADWADYMLYGDPQFALKPPQAE